MLPINELQQKIESIIKLYTETKDSILVGYRISSNDDNKIIITCCDFDGLGKTIHDFEINIVHLNMYTPEHIAEALNSEHKRKMQEAEENMKRKIRQMNIESFIRTGKSLGIEDESRKLIRAIYDGPVKLD